jgi:adenylate kinase
VWYGDHRDLDLRSRDTTEHRPDRIQRRSARRQDRKVDEATHEAGGSFIVVDTGPWIFGKKVMLPAGVIRDIDPDTETIFVDFKKDEIKNAPEFDEKTYRDQGYRNELGSDYSGRGSGRSGTT